MFSEEDKNNYADYLFIKALETLPDLVDEYFNNKKLDSDNE